MLPSAAVSSPDIFDGCDDAAARVTALVVARAGGSGCAGRRAAAPGRLVVGADDLEVLVLEDVVGPVDADVVDLVVTVAECYDPVDDAAGVGGQRGFGRLVCGGAADDCARPLGVVRRDLADLLGGALLALAVRDHLPARVRPAAGGRIDDDLGGRDGRAIGRPQHEGGLAGSDGTG